MRIEGQGKTGATPKEAAPVFLMEKARGLRIKAHSRANNLAIALGVFDVE